MNHPHNLLVLATLAVLLFCLAAAMGVARARRKHGLPPPAMSGNEIVERSLRVHANSLEWLPLILVPMWLFHLYFGQIIPTVLGCVWIIGRALYWAGYVRSPDQRYLGFAIQGLAVVILVLGAAFGAIRAFLVMGA